MWRMVGLAEAQVRTEKGEVLGRKSLHMNINIDINVHLALLSFLFE